MAQTNGAPVTELPPIEVTTPGPGTKTKKAPSRKAQPPSPPPAPPAPDHKTEFGFYNPALDLQIELPPGTTLTTAGPVDGYRALTAVSATKTATPVGDLPQSMQVIPRSVIREQGATTIGDAIKNVSGVAVTNAVRTPGYDYVTIRGFEAEQWVDGFGVFYNIGNRDALANVERIEVLKGPNAILYGGGNGAPIGGAVNVISKLPTNVPGGEFGVTFGSESYARPYFDINQPVASDGSVLFRMTGEYTSTESFIDIIESERYSLNPTLTLTNKTDTTLTLQARATHWAQQEYQGLPAVGTVSGDFDIRRDLFIGPRDVPDSTSYIRGITAALDHKIDDTLAVHAKARWSTAGFLQMGQLLLGADGFRANEPVAAPSTWTLTNAVLDQDQREFAVAGNMDAKFAAGGARHVFLLGADHSRIVDEGYFAWDIPFGGQGPVDLSAPSFPNPYVNPGNTPATTFAGSTKEYVNAGIYAQLQSSIADRLHVVAGLRLAHVDVHARSSIDGSIDDASKTRLLPRLGGLYEIVEDLAVYASYSRGLKGQPLLSHNGAPDPDESEQKEAGIKFELGELTGTAAIFEIVRTDVPVLDGLTPVGTSSEIARGFEADFIWQPSAHWRLIGSYAYLDAFFAQPIIEAPAGNRLVAVPEHAGRLWVHHDLEPAALKGWSIGAGVYAATSQAIEYANRHFAKGYFTVDARLGYDGGNFAADLTIKNLTDEEYIVPFDYFRGRVAPGEPRTLYGTLVHRY